MLVICLTSQRVIENMLLKRKERTKKIRFLKKVLNVLVDSHERKLLDIFFIIKVFGLIILIMVAYVIVVPVVLIIAHKLFNLSVTTMRSVSKYA